MSALALRLSAWLPAAFLLFVASAFVLPNGPSYALVFYLGVLPCLFARLGAGPAIALGDPARLAALALVAWSGLSLLWGHDDGHRVWRFAADTACTGAFLLAMLAVLDGPSLRAGLARVLVVAGSLNAVFSMAVFFITHPIFPRLTGWGATTHPILGAAVMSVACLTAVARALADARAFDRALHLAAALVMAAFILLTESRGPLLAAFAGVVFLCAASKWRLRAFAGLAAFVLTWFMLPHAARRQSEAVVLVERGSSHRFEVWDYTLAQIRARPLFGHGLASNLHLSVGDGRRDAITFPHDLYLSLLYYSGAVGLAIFAAMAGLLTMRLVRRDADWSWVTALWLNVLVVGLTDIGQITKGPGPVWFIVWLPVGLLLTRTKVFWSFFSKKDCLP